MYKKGERERKRAKLWIYDQLSSRPDNSGSHKCSDRDWTRKQITFMDVKDTES